LFEEEDIRTIDCLQTDKWNEEMRVCGGCVFFENEIFGVSEPFILLVEPGSNRH